MLQKNGLYIVEVISLTITDENTKKEIILYQDEIIKILDFKGINVIFKKEKTSEIFEVSKLGLNFAVSRIK